MVEGSMFARFVANAPWSCVHVLILASLFPASFSLYVEKSETFLSPKFILGPGSVENRYYYNIDFPRGHVALKGFDAEVVNEFGTPVPLHETYLHHWVVEKYYENLQADISERNEPLQLNRSDRIFARNSGTCQGHVLRHYFGLGSETRKTSTHIPDPYGIEIGNQDIIPDGYEERWLLNVHAIDTRGVRDRLGCTECKCDLYNVTLDEFGRPLKQGYDGGLLCCYDHTQCSLRHGFEAPERTLYLRYTVKWVEWDALIIPVKIYILDVTDNGERIYGPGGIDPNVGCRVEYEIAPCAKTDAGSDTCIDFKRTNVTFPTSGFVVYGVAHQHTGGIGSTLYRMDGSAICTSKPFYGKGHNAGDEAGYVVGMSSCYPKHGSVKLSEGETLVLESRYNSTQKHTGVMGLFFILIADKAPESKLSISDVVQGGTKHPVIACVTVALFAGIIFITVIVPSWIKPKDDNYQPIMF